MIIEPHNIRLHGHSLHRLILRPKGPSRGSLLFFHGQGDFIDRYPPILEAFVKNGLTCLLTDLPGHGQSSGGKGHIPSFAFVDDLLKKSLQQLTGPVTIAGHSMGGLLALRALLKHPHLFSSAWISSPLLDPARQSGPLLRLLLPQIARLLPWITWSTGVKAAQCRTGDEPLPPAPERDPLYHGRISLGWARELILAAKALEDTFLSLPTQIPILFTQGSADPICPAEILKRRLRPLSHSNVRYHELSEALHEPFIGEHGDEIQEVLRRWSEKL